MHSSPSCNVGEVRHGCDVLYRHHTAVAAAAIALQLHISTVHSILCVVLDPLEVAADACVDARVVGSSTAMAPAHHANLVTHTHTHTDTISVHSCSMKLSNYGSRDDKVNSV